MSSVSFPPAQPRTLRHTGKSISRASLSGASTPDQITLSERTQAAANKTHWIWMGKTISNKHLENLVAFADKHPHRELILWTDNPHQTKKALRSLASQNLSPQDFKKVSDLKKRLHIQSIEKDLLNKEHSKLSKLLDPETVKELISAVMRESNGPFLNYAAASDILRLLILYRHGGLYLDTDVLTKETFNAANFLDAPAHINAERLGNAVLYSKPEAAVLKANLMAIAADYNLKKLGTPQKLEQIYQENPWLVDGQKGMLKLPAKSATESSGVNYAAGPKRWPTWATSNPAEDNRSNGTLWMTGPQSLIAETMNDKPDKRLLFKENRHLRTNFGIPITLKSEHAHWTEITRETAISHKSSSPFLRKKPDDTENWNSHRREATS